MCLICMEVPFQSASTELSHLENEPHAIVSNPQESDPLQSETESSSPVICSYALQSSTHKLREKSVSLQIEKGSKSSDNTHSDDSQ